MTTPTAASLLHLVDRAERGSLLAEEAQQLRSGIRALGARGQEMEQLRADLARVQQAACGTAEALRLNSKRLDAVLADRESERAARTAEEKRARTAKAAIERVKNLAEVWADAPDPLVRAGARDLRTTVAGPQPPTTEA
ncbi:hypothetical protein [Streptomyces sp. LN590]|uniref:hypothetical protein n=1 Tax=Streptomyces sp. LN590 TaxID=3112980 RepID=UPI0037141D30